MNKVSRNDPCPCGSGKKYKKCCLNKPKRVVHETLEKFFGKEWIERELNKVKLSGYKNLNPMNLAALDIHPVIKAIVDTQIKLNLLKESKQQYFPIGRAEIFQNLLHQNLILLEPILDFSSVQRRLRDKKEYPKIEYEIMIAAGYRRLGYHVDFIKPISARRSGEFYITNVSDKILVECKKKNLLSPQEEKINNWWKEFQHLTMEKLRTIKKRFGIIVEIPNDATRGEVKALLSEITSLLNSEACGIFNLREKRYKVTLKKFCNDGEAISAASFFSFGKDCAFGVSSSMQKHSEWPAGKEPLSQVQDPMFVGAVEPLDDFDSKIRSIISTFREAYGQLEDNKPNIVYTDINISSMMPYRSQELLRRLKPNIETKLAKDFSKISAVVLTNIKPIGDSSAGGFHVDEETILNAKTKYAISDNFRIYGDKKGGKGILRDIKEVIDENL